SGTPGQEEIRYEARAAGGSGTLHSCDASESSVLDMPLSHERWRPFHGLKWIYILPNLGFRIRSTPGRGPRPSISAGVRDFMLSPAPRVRTNIIAGEKSRHPPGTYLIAEVWAAMIGILRLIDRSSCS